MRGSPRRGYRSRTSSAAPAPVWGRAAEAVADAGGGARRGTRRRRRPVPVHGRGNDPRHDPAAQRCSGLGVEECVAALGDHEVRDRVVAEMERGISGWENVAADPGWAGIRISYAPSHPDWAGRSLAELGEDLTRIPADLAFDALDRRPARCLGRHRLHGSMPDVETIMAVPWIAVCTDARGPPPGPSDPRRRPAASADVREHGPGARHVRPRARHARARDGRRQADRRARPARLGLRDRGVLRDGAFADLVVFDPATVADVATYVRARAAPGRHRHVVVNGRVAVRAGRRPASEPGGCCGGPDEADDARDGERSPAAARPWRRPRSRHSPAGRCRTRCGTRRGRAGCGS